PAQLPPKGDWTNWLLIGGRGSGKTRAGAEWVKALALGKDWASPAKVSPIALVSETQAQARAVMLEGVSGLLAVHDNEDRPNFDRGRGELVWPNGSMARIFGAGEPDSLRGHQFAAAWCDELAKWPRAEAAWDMLQFGLRLGEHPRQLVTTTPRPIALLKRLRAEAGTVVTHMTTEENKDFLAPDFLARIVARYQGSVLGRQELLGEFVEDDPDALWRRADFDRGRLFDLPELGRIVVSVDPPVTSHERSDGCGIIVAGRAGERALVIEDLTLRPAPLLDWARRAVAAFHRHRADAIVAEVNQGGELVANLIAQVDAKVPVKQVRASRGKWLRAEPVAALYGRGLVSHFGALPELEDEMCAFGRDGIARGSPDRVD
ncbi:MAG: terminase family protein, partial [Cucumibacter sp.]